MLDHEPNGSGTSPEPTDTPNASDASAGSVHEAAETASPAPRRRRAASRPAGTPPPAVEAAAADAASEPPAKPKRTRKTAAKKATAGAVAAPVPAEKAAPEEKAAVAVGAPAASEEAAPTTTRRRRTRATAAAPPVDEAAPAAEESAAVEVAAPATEDTAPAKPRRTRKRAGAPVKTVAEPPAELPAAEEDEEEPGAGETEPETAPVQQAPALRPGALIFQAPVVTEPVRRTRTRATAAQGKPRPIEGAPADESAADEQKPAAAAVQPSAEEAPAAERESRRRRRRRGHAGEVAAPAAGSPVTSDTADEETAHGDTDDDNELGATEGSSRRRRRRRRRQTAEDLAVGTPGADDPPNTVVKIREPRERRSNRNAEPDSLRTGDDVLGVRGSVRLAAKQQRRREGRTTRSRRAPIVTEAEFLARRESVERVMVVRQSANRTQIGVLEDGVLVEHYVNRESSVSYVGNVYLGKVQNVLPSMEAAFVDINKGRNAVLYAGEVNFSAAGLEGQPKRIESALKSGQPVLVQVTKDPIGHKGARLTSQISLPGRFLVYIPGGSMMGISRKLPDNERTRLKQILKKVVPEDGGVIVRTAAEGASEEELAKDVERLVAQWEEIERRSRTANAPALLYGEPDLTVRVIRDIFNEDFTKLIVSGDDAYKEIHEYLSGVAPELAERIEHWTSETDAFSVFRVDEQLAKALDRKVWLPSGGSLVIDRTEAMVVIDVNTGKFTGQGTNSLEETVTRNNLEAAEEIVRQLRLRDLGGIIVIDFIDMVLESNRELVLRRLLECLGRDRTKHQVAEVTSLGLVQMTRKRVGQGLLEAFSETCDHCNGRGVIIHLDPVEPHGRRGGDRPVAAQDVSAAEFETEHTASAAESRASRRRKRKGKHHEGEEVAIGSSADTAEADEAPAMSSEPLNLRAH
ncbi:MAG TPA: Rne/Rng family ribonuclease, partial [Thermoleophilia bacterium]|nr:Rne/Rng family ribonuclease [Thermoleophilia bacterium]